MFVCHFCGFSKVFSNSLTFTFLSGRIELADFLPEDSDSYDKITPPVVQRGMNASSAHGNGLLESRKCVLFFCDTFLVLDPVIVHVSFYVPGISSIDEAAMVIPYPFSENIRNFYIWAFLCILGRHTHWIWFCLKTGGTTACVFRTWHAMEFTSILSGLMRFGVQILTFEMQDHPNSKRFLFQIIICCCTKMDHSNMWWK